jgi:hypothetical protein
MRPNSKRPGGQLARRIHNVFVCFTVQIQHSISASLVFFFVLNTVKTKLMEEDFEKIPECAVQGH